MKNFIYALMLFCLCMPASAADIEWTEVCTASEFKEAFNSHKNIKLTADIDLDGYVVNNTGTGLTAETYDYCNGEICGLKDSYNDGEVPYYTIKNANVLCGSIKNLKMHHLVISEAWRQLFNNTYNCSFEQIALEKSGTQVKGNAMSSIITGYDSGSTFSYIEVINCSLFWEDSSTGSSAGFLAAAKYGGSIDHCMVNATCNAYATNGKIGSFVGRAADNFRIEDCISFATIIGNADMCGGIVGHTTASTINNCQFYGIVKQTSLSKETYQDYIANYPVATALYNVGYRFGWDTVSMIKNAVAWQHICAVGFQDVVKGVAILYEKDLFNEFMLYLLGYGSEMVDYELLFDVSFGIETAMLIWSIKALGQMGWTALEGISGPDEVGGIVGHATSTSIAQCSNYGMVYSLDAYCGGIVGYGESSTTVKDCLNQGAVHGDEQTGGIAGSIHGGSMTTCMNLGSIACTTVATAGRICGDPEDGAVLSYNCYSDLSSDLDGTKTDQLRISQEDIVSGKAAVFMNAKSNTSLWRQTIGEDHWPNLKETSLVPTTQEINTSLSTVVEADDRSTLICAMVNPYSNINITNDIDFEGYPAYNLSSVYMPFRGTINGNGHRISNITYTQNGKKFALFGMESLWTTIENVGILSYAENATFSNIILDNIQLDAATNLENVSLFVANSKNCTYNNISIGGCSAITESDHKGHTVWKVGGIVGYSYGDHITNCSVGSNCKLYAYGATDGVMLGGIAGYATNTEFYSCWNAAELSSYKNQNIGGIVGQTVNSQVAKCLNTGDLYGAANMGGIIGQMDCTSRISNSATDCDIVGQSDAEGMSYNPYIAGFVGYCPKGSSSTATIASSLLFGTVRSPSSTSMLMGRNADDDSNVACDLTNCYYYNTFNGDSYNNFDADILNNYITGEKPGEIGNWLNANTNGVWYQDIDNNTFPVRIPVPLSAAGTIYQNYDCKSQTTEYSNKYSATSGHTTATDKFGLCTQCGAIYDAPSAISLSTGQDIVGLSYATNNGQDFSNSTLSLEQDVDLSVGSLGTTFAPIGTYSHPFKGTFNGNSHRIKNMYLDGSDGIKGFFGCVGGKTTINDVIIDSTSFVNTASYGAAGLIGAMTTDGDEGNYVLNINRCGNEADVIGNTNAAGILGGIFAKKDADVVTLNIDHCYNTGTITGDKESAAICGYAGDAAYIDYSWNSGTVTGCDEGYPFVRYNSANASAICHLKHCYGIASQTDLETTSLADVSSGRLCYLLNQQLDGTGVSNYANNTSGGVWYQQIETDPHPVTLQTAYNLVYHHDYSYCNTPSVVETLYNNSSAALPSIKHDYDTDGICTLTEGEIHGKEPTLADNTWQITKMGNLYWIASQVNAGGTQYDCELMNDVTDNARVQILGYLCSNYASFHNWTPIGTSSHPFTKSFNGNYHTISGLYCDKGIADGSSLEPVGLFGVLQDNLSVANVSVQDCYFRSYWKVGLLAGSVVNSTLSPRIHDIYTIGAVKGVAGLGGVIGYIQDKNFNAKSISNCWTLTPITREKDPTFNVYDQVNNGAFVGNIKIDDDTQYTGNLTNCFYIKGTADFTSTFGTEKETSDLISGDVCHLLNTVDGSELSTPVWGQNLGTESAPVFTSSGLRHERNMSSIWGTVVLPYAVSSNDDVQFYKVTSCDVSSTEGKLVLTPVTDVAANTPCFFKKLNESATSVCFSKGTNAFTLTSGDSQLITASTNAKGWSIVGSYDQLTGLTGVYYIASNKLWYAEAAITVPAYRAYLTCTNASPAKSLAIFVDEGNEVDQIGEISADGNINFYDQPVYNLAGQRVTGSAKGIVIIGGKKYLKK